MGCGRPASTPYRRRRTRLRRSALPMHLRLAPTETGPACPGRLSCRVCRRCPPSQGATARGTHSRRCAAGPGKMHEVVAWRLRGCSWTRSTGAASSAFSAMLTMASGGTWPARFWRGSWRSKSGAGTVLPTTCCLRWSRMHAVPPDVAAAHRSRLQPLQQLPRCTPVWRARLHRSAPWKARWWPPRARVRRPRARGKAAASPWSRWTSRSACRADAAVRFLGAAAPLGHPGAVKQASAGAAGWLPSARASGARHLCEVRRRRPHPWRRRHWRCGSLPGSCLAARSRRRSRHRTCRTTASSTASCRRRPRQPQLRPPHWSLPTRERAPGH